MTPLDAPFESQVIPLSTIDRVTRSHKPGRLFEMKAGVVLSKGHVMYLSPVPV